jgi:hypothetical protein
MTRRPSLIEGAIRPGGNPVESSRRRSPPQRSSSRASYAAEQQFHKVGLQYGNSILSKKEEDESSTASSDTQDLSTLYQLCEASQDLLGQEEVEEIWYEIRAWLTLHPSIADRHAACVQQGMFNTTPLHLLCQHPNAPLDIIRTITESAPEITSWADTNGWLPMHIACAKGASHVLPTLGAVYPEGKVAQDRRMRTPLHFSFFRSGEENKSSRVLGPTFTVYDKIQQKKRDEAVKEIVYYLRSASKVLDEKGRLPLHFAAAYGTTRETLEILYTSFPEGINVTENMERSPLHYVMANAHGCASPCVLQFLLERLGHDTVHSLDCEGNMPLNLLASRAAKLSMDDLDESIAERNNVAKCLVLYLNTRPKSSADFLAALQSLPVWLRDDAVTHFYMQEILNKKIAKRFPTSILLLDGYIYIITIVCFHIASRAHIDHKFGEEDLPIYTKDLLAICLVGVTYFLLRVLTQVISMISLGTLRSWLLQATNWLDIAVVALIYHYCRMMMNGFVDEMFREGVAFTIAALWVAVINFLKSIMLEFSVFFETVLYVTKHLFIFMLALGVILISYAEMFFILYRGTTVCNSDCKTNFGSFPHCTFGDSLLKVYTMMLGEVGDVNRYQQNFAAQLFYIGFVFLVVILLSNILIAIVTETHSVVKNERAEMVFWSNRLDFIAEMDALVSMIDNCFRAVGLAGILHTRDSETQVLLQGTTKEWGILGEAWNQLLVFLKEDPIEETSFLEFWAFCFLRTIVVIICIPLWLIVGLLSAGWLWPPQVREWLFVPRKVPRSRAAIENDLDQEITSMTEEVGNLNTELVERIQQTNDKCAQTRDEFEEIKAALKIDIDSVKEGLALVLRQSELSHRRQSTGTSCSDLTLLHSN